MKLLLDSHILIWAASDRWQRLPSTITDALVDETNHKLISPASLAEIAVKASIGKLNIRNTFFDEVVNLGADMAPFEAEHAKVLAGLPMIHRDPFDRMLVAQAIVDGATLVTIDQTIKRYDVPTLP